MVPTFSSSNTRRRLPNRRASLTFGLKSENHGFTCTFSRLADGRIGEIFLQNFKPGSQLDANARDAAVAASLALQFGCPIEILQRALLRDSRGNPSTPLGAAIDEIVGASSC
jgi:hypothetical protein